MCVCVCVCVFVCSVAGSWGTFIHNYAYMN